MRKESVILFFDIGNVLNKPITKDVIIKLCKSKKSDILVEAKINEELEKIMFKSYSGDISYEDSIGELAKKLETEKKIIEKVIDEFVVERNEELITKIKNNIDNYELGLISDLNQISWKIVQNNYKDLLTLCKPNLINISVNTGKTKRDGKEDYFRKIIKEQEAYCKKIIFIDDERNNIDSAMKSGIDAIPYGGCSLENEWSYSNRKLFYELNKREISF